MSKKVHLLLFSLLAMVFFTIGKWDNSLPGGQQGIDVSVATSVLQNSLPLNTGFGTTDHFRPKNAMRTKAKVVTIDFFLCPLVFKVPIQRQYSMPAYFGYVPNLFSAYHSILSTRGPPSFIG